jgi:hypothetical protein
MKLSTRYSIVMLSVVMLMVKIIFMLTLTMLCVIMLKSWRRNKSFLTNSHLCAVS